MIILVSGKAGVGKTTFSNMLVEEFQKQNRNAEVKSFAYYVKQIAKHMFSWDGNKDANGRKLLQFIGEKGREITPIFWAKLLATDLNTYSIFIIDDWRYKNEFLYLNNLFDVVRIRIEAKDREILAGTSEYSHQSEVDLDGFNFNYIYYNSGDIQQLRAFAKSIAAELTKNL